jgi:glycosyltransferase involved in cell wall biosynthesis
LDGVKVFGLPKWKHKKDRKKIRKIIYDRIRESDADYFHFHDPELIFSSILIKLKGKKVIFDVHENVRKQIGSKEGLSALKKLFFASMYWILEKTCSFFIDKFLLAEYSYKKIYPTAKSEIILNYPHIIEVKDRAKTAGKIVYVGNWIERERGSVELVEALNLLKEDQIDFQLFWFGLFHSDGKFERELKNIIEKYDLTSKIIFVGRMDYSELFDFIADANLGYSCLHPTQNFVGSYPTKMFEYMMARVPVVISNFALWQKVVEKNNCGLSVDPLQPEQIAQAMRELIQDTEKAKIMGQNGRDVVEQKFNWTIEEKKMLEIYNKM